MPLWYCLLYYWCYKKVPICSGLTLPFLVGAENESGIRQDQFTISELLTEFKELSNGYTVSLRRCSMINEIVCSLDDNNFEQAHYLAFQSLTIEDTSLSQINEFQLIAKQLEEDYSGRINDGNFSKHLGHWQSFTQEDKQTIAIGLKLQSEK